MALSGSTERRCVEINPLPRLNRNMLMITSQMEYPGYLLNPGDMFSVDPERVLFATGARKYRKTSPDTLQGVAKDDETDLVVDDDAEDLLDDAEEAATAAQDATEDAQSETKSEDADADTTKPGKPSEDPKKTILTLVKNAKSIMSDNKTTLSAKRKQELRAFSQTAKKALSQIRGTRIDANTPLEETIDGLEETLKSISLKVPGSSSTKTEATESPAADATDATSATPAVSSNPQAEAQSGKEDAYLARKNAELLHAALQRAQDNPIDVRRPYATPWKPREFMSAFAFIPRYLEVNQNICSAVYIRHPVARPGLAEVPTPFHGETMGLAFNWYLRRR